MNVKQLARKLTPSFLLGWYHWLWAFCGAWLFGFPSRRITVIGVTGTSGKSTVVDFVSRIFEEAGIKAASTSSVRFTIGKKEWKNKFKMTMPGRLVIQQFLRQAVDAGCRYAVLEVTSEGIRQFRHKFIEFDAAVFTNLSAEHIESHGGFENYRNAKLKLFKAAKNVHVVNVEDENAKWFLNLPAKKVITFGLEKGEVNWSNASVQLQLLGDFNRANALAAIAVARHYGIPLETCRRALEKVQREPGRMEVVSQQPLVVVDYAHTPAQLEGVYRTFASRPLICVLGSCGGGRDKWKRPLLGEIAAKHCREVIITNEDPYDEDPLAIINQVAEGVGGKAEKIIDRREAIQKAIRLAQSDDAVVITGKGSEVWMVLANGKKIPWDDRQIVREALAARNS